MEEFEKNNAIEKAENAMGENEQGKKPLEILLERETQRIEQEKKIETFREKEQKSVLKKKAKAVFLQEKMKERAEMKERKAKLKQMREENRKTKQTGGDKKRKGWIAAVVSLSIATIALSSALMVTLLTPSKADGMLEQAYNRAFYDTVEQVDNIDLNLAKALSTKDTGAMQKYLINLAINSELAESDLQQLPLQDESKFYTTKLINQIGDYAKYLNNKLINGESLNEQDLLVLQGLYKENKTFREALHKMSTEMGVDYSFSTMIDGGDGNLIINKFNQLQNLSVEYPELIYDGPFSDGQNKREIKGLSGDEIDKMRAEEIFKKAFAKEGVTDVKSVGVASGVIECFNVQGEIKGEQIFAQISKRGGKIIMFDYAGSCKDVNITRDRAVEKAQEFLSSLEIKDITPVWINLANNVYTMNFAYEKEGVIVYNDLIKVRVCAETEMVIGMEARGYYTNHTERQVATPTISEEVARQKLSQNIEVESVKIALVPIGNNTEKLAYEFYGKADGNTYYIYIDALTGKQIEMFMVIDSLGGQMLI